MDTFHVLVVDDDFDVYSMTKLVLHHFKYHDRELDLSYLPSGVEAIQYIGQGNPIDLILLDIVMETEFAGYTVVDYVRNVKNDKATSIVLRTGFPGDVRDDYIHLIDSINGFLYKNECTYERLVGILRSEIDRQEGYAS